MYASKGHLDASGAPCPDFAGIPRLVVNLGLRGYFTVAPQPRPRPQSTAASAAGVHVMDSLVQHIQREKEPILHAARHAKYPGIKRERGLLCICVASKYLIAKAKKKKRSKRERFCKKKRTRIVISRA